MTITGAGCLKQARGVSRSFGTGAICVFFPGNKLPGYSQTSLRDDKDVKQFLRLVTSTDLRPRHPLLFISGLLRFPEQYDAVGVGALEIVVHAPAVGGFGEFLVVDEDEDGFQASGDAAGQDGFLQFDFAAPDFADFKGDVATGL